MQQSNGKKIRNNLFYGVFNQFLTLIIGLTIPRLLLTSYGSEVNGLLTTVSQIFVYVGLLEAGIGTASLNALYRPVVDNDRDAISDVFSATQKYYRKVTVIYALVVLASSLIYPLCVKTSLGYVQVVLVMGLQGLSGALTFYFSAAYKQVLAADGKNYIVSNITLIIYILSSITKILLMGLGYNIVILQFGYCIVNCIQIVIFVVVMNKKYPWLKKHKNPNMSTLSQRKAFLVHEISSVIFSSTDAFVLSTFCGLLVASVYSIYSMVFVALNSLISAVNSGLSYLLGQSYAKNDGSYVKIHDMYDSLYMALTFSVFSVAYMLICPFIKIYTTDIVDIEYVDYLLPILFVSIQFLSCSRAASVKLINIAGHAKATQRRSIIESGINLVSSIVLANVIGIYGVLLGTVIALLYRSNDIIIYANIKILHRSPLKTYISLGVNVVIFGLLAILEFAFREQIANLCNTYISFALCGIVFVIVSVVLFFGAAMVYNPEVREYIIKRVKAKSLRREK